ncbi:MAG: hypothetical protein ACXWIN_04305, partial [Burkholderiaceae bacterium]
MTHISDTITTNMEQFLKSHEQKSHAHLVICSSVDDGTTKLIDGLTAGREHGSTIDSANYFFATGRRKFIVTNTPDIERHMLDMLPRA